MSERPDIETWLKVSEEGIRACLDHFGAEECAEECDCDDAQYKALATYALALEQERGRLVVALAKVFRCDSEHRCRICHDIADEALASLQPTEGSDHES